MSIYDRIEAAIRRHVKPSCRSTRLFDALEQAAVEPIIEAVGNIDCCCPCCDSTGGRRRDLIVAFTPAIHAASVDL